MANITKSKLIYTLLRPVWLDHAGMSKGINHDRQHLGIILAARQVIKIRQTNATFSTNLTMRLLNDDGKTEAEFRVGSRWVEAHIDAVSVPFIDTPYVNGTPMVEFEYPDTTKTLPVYRKGENEATFFNRWDNQDAEFGFIESEYVNVLVPKISKTRLKAIGKNQGIDGLIAYYDRIFTFYNALTGISFEPGRDSDRNIKNRYFMKADKHGAGGAYYSDRWIAESSSSISSFCLTLKDNEWGILHEIGHGYQGHFMKDRYFSTGEIWNNIYAACYQDMMLGDRKYQEGWLYDYGKREEVEKKIVDLIAQATSLNQWDLRSKLYFMVLMINKAGNNAFTYFNQQYRKNCNTKGFIPSENLLLDMLSDCFTMAGEQVDVTPFIQLTGGYLTQMQCDLNMLSQAKAVYPLYRLINEPSQLEAVKNQLKLDSSLRLVDSTQLKATELKGNVSLYFNIDDFAQIYGEELIVMEGARYAYKMPINSPTMKLDEVPIGVYTLHLPTGKNNKYQLSTNYLVVKQGDNKAEISFTKKFNSPIVSQQIELLGLADVVFSTLLIDRVQNKIVIDVITTTPHSRFAGELYAIITVRDISGEVIFMKAIYGTGATLSHDELPLSIGSQIEILHMEPSRVRVNPNNPNIIDNKNITNILIITNNGLKNRELNSDPEQVLLERLENAVKDLRNYPFTYYSKYSPFKDDIYLAINNFASPKREQLLASYKDFIPVDNSQPGDNVGNAFTFVGKEPSNRQFLTATLDLVKKTLTVKIEAGIANNSFSGVYASIAYEDADGNNLYYDELIGNQTQQARSVVLPLSGYGGEVIRLYHQEPATRLTITNDMQQIQLAENGKQQTYQITTTGLERLAD